MNIDGYISGLINYAKENGLIAGEDEVWAINGILDILKLQEYESTESPEQLSLEELLEGILDYAVAEKLIEDSTLDRDQAEYLQEIADRVVLPNRERWLMGAGEEEDDTLSIGSVKSDYLRIYPNPTTGLVHIEARGEVLVCDLRGNRRTVEIRNGLLDLSALEPGVYYLQVGERKEKVVVCR